MQDAPAENPETFDYGSDGDPDGAVVAEAFRRLDDLVLRAERATEERKRAELALKRAVATEEQLLNRDIPDVCKSMRLDKLTTSSGVEVTIKRDIKASLPGHDRVSDRQGALAWLVDHNHGGVIKNVVRVDLDRGEDSRADELVASLTAQGFTPVASKDVHTSTLGALVRELMAAGTVVPKQLFNLFDLRVAKLVRK